MEEKHIKFIEVLKRAHGNIAGACRAVDINRTTYYRWLELEEFALAVDEVFESFLDNAESKLQELINGTLVERETGDDVQIYTKPPDFNAIKYFLSTKGKKRGYVEKLETENKTENKIMVAIDYGDTEGE